MAERPKLKGTSYLVRNLERFPSENRNKQSKEPETSGYGKRLMSERS